MRLRSIVIASLALAGAVSLWGQARSRSAGPERSRPAASGPSNASGSRSVPTIQGGGGSGSYGRYGAGGWGSYGDPYNSSHFYGYPYSFSGRVFLPGGGAFLEPAIIQSVCAGSVSPLAYSDRSGRFSFHLGGVPFGLDPFLLQSLRYGAGPWGYSSMGMSGCGLRAYLPGYTSALFSLAGRDAYQSPNIGKLELARSGDIEGASVSVTSLVAPKEAKKHYEKALKHLRDGELEKAAKRLEQAIELHPEYAAAWALLGEVRQALRYESGVREAFERAIEIDPQYLRPYLPLVRIEIGDKDWERAAQLAEKAGRLNPMETEVRFHLAWAQYQMRRFDEAATTINSLLAAGDPSEHPQVHALAGMLLAEEGQVNEAVAQYRRYLANRPATQLAATLKKQIASWEAEGRLARAGASSAKNPPPRPAAP